MQSNARKMSARLLVGMVKLQLLMGEKNMRWQGEIQGVIFVSAPIPLGLKYWDLNFYGLWDWDYDLVINKNPLQRRYSSIVVNPAQLKLLENLF